MPAARTNQYIVLAQGHSPTSFHEVKRSKFLGFAHRVSNETSARAFIASVRQSHREARHACHGFVIGPDRGAQRSSDDGEPSGTAGAPILKSILSRQTTPGHCELSDIIVVVIRYFGGIKLGAGGLIQAYSDASVAALDQAHFAQRIRVQVLGLPVSFAQSGRVESALRAAGFNVLDTQYQNDGALLNVAVPDDPTQLARANGLFAELLAGQDRAEVLRTDWLDRDLT